MYRVLEIILDGITASLSIPYVVHRVLERNPNIKVDFNESEKTVALESVIAWENWAEFGSRGSYLDCRNMDVKHRDLCNELIKKYDFSNFISIQSIEKWQCDIRDIEGLSSSKSKLEIYPTLDDFAVRGTTEFLDDISEENLNKMLGYSEMRIINNSNTSDHFIQHQWDGRIFLMNDGGSHHFAAARYIAKKLKKEVAITGRLERYTFNQPLITELLEDFDIFIMRERDIFGNFFEAMRIYGVIFCIYWLPRQFGNKKMLLFPKKYKRSKQVANMLIDFDFFDFGKYLYDTCYHQT